jgi:hypothetical protein
MPPQAAERKIYMTKINEAIAALKEEYELKLAEKEAENARLRGKKRDDLERLREAAREYEKYLNEYISVKLFKDNDRYKDDVYVAVNGQNCIIKRGEWVRIKRKFALVLDSSEIQDMKTAEFIEREQRRFSEAN